LPAAAVAVEQPGLVAVVPEVLSLQTLSVLHLAHSFQLLWERAELVARTTTPVVRDQVHPKVVMETTHPLIQLLPQ
jgi:hypothetical protein